VGSEEFVVLMFAVPHLSQCLRVQNEVGRLGPVAWITRPGGSRVGRDVWIAVGGLLPYAKLSLWHITYHVAAQGRGRQVLIAVHTRQQVRRGRP
jgi:hypothetical protein